MPDYQNAKIYKLVNDTLGLTYYGSTTKKLSVRKGQHKYQSTRKNTTSKLLFQGEGKVDIVLVEKFPCNDKEELNMRERFYIENNECVNKNVPGRTGKEYYENNKEQICEQNKEYHQKNKEQICERKKDYYQNNKEQIIEQMKEYYQANKDKIQQKINCECGGRYIFKNKKRHLETKKHKNFISDSV